MDNPKYQLLDTLLPEEYAALEADILKRGVQIPIELDEQGNILDGHHRKAIADKHGLPCPSIKRTFATEEEKKEHVLKINLARRHLDRVRKGGIIKKLAINQGVVLGFSGRKSNDANELNSAKVSQFFLSLGIPKRTAERCVADHNKFESLSPNLQEEVRTGKKKLHKATSEVKKRREKDSRLKAAKVFDPNWLLGNWRQYIGTLADGSVTLLLSDPPYGINYRSDFRLDRNQEHANERIENDAETALTEISEMLAAMMPKLRDNAHILLFCHWSNEPEVRDVVEATGLKIRGSLIWDKIATGMGDVQTTFAPAHERIIHAVKGSPKLLSRPADVLSFGRVGSEHHPTQKPIDLLKVLIEATTVKRELVIDPFGGVASTLVAAKECGRSYWGCEIKEKYWQHGQERLEGNGDSVLPRQQKAS